jgi:hypothetical protein
MTAVGADRPLFQRSTNARDCALPKTRLRTRTIATKLIMAHAQRHEAPQAAVRGLDLGAFKMSRREIDFYAV